LNINSILNWLILDISNKKYGTNGCATPEYIKQWRHLEILLHFEVLKKSYFYDILLYELMFSNPKFQMVWMKIDWIMERPCLAAFLNFYAILKCYSYSYFFFLWSRLPKYVIRSTLKLISHGTFFSYTIAPAISV
jgi:hypothetical protein